eukprot:CAMPEP_0185831120 /NCGR_PEP_ID=MMETSP1353-20130828/1298_1 /TAXON_ID=1077150 /ORGANISM="Erythrolobus australicus, Strain CCMP3124" /LENGTH=45 /DNA_ID= /DNA_START= /DNA_END= /DNA_ORIENTATION=
MTRKVSAAAQRIELRVERLGYATRQSACVTAVLQSIRCILLRNHL